MKMRLFRRKRICSLFLAVVMLLAMLPAQAFAVNEQNGPSSFLAGPYLLAPKTNGMVVVWELDEPMKSTFEYGTSADTMQTMDVPVEEGEVFQGEAMHMYRARLTGLTPDTRYTYKVTAENGQSVEGSFRTLPENALLWRFSSSCRRLVPHPAGKCGGDPVCGRQRHPPL